jgi:hypothetical protein
LGLPEGLELPKKIENITKADLNDKFLKSIDGGNADVSTIRLYMEKVCP